MLVPNIPGLEIIVEVGFTLGASTQNYLHVGDVVRGIVGTAAVAPDQLWTDVTDRVHRISLTSGASSRISGPLVEYEAGTATILMDNSDGALDPTNINSPFYVPDQIV